MSVLDYIPIQFIKGDLEDGEYVADFGDDGDGREFFGYRGMHYALWLEKHPFVRKSFIYVVRQRDAWKTLKIFVHELTHAAIWLFHLPAKWSLALDERRWP